MKKTGWKVSEGGKVVTRRQLEHSLNQLAQTFIKGMMQLEEHFDARLKQLELPDVPVEIKLAQEPMGQLILDGGYEARPVSADEKVPA
jgi:hypothetical protein